MDLDGESILETVPLNSFDRARNGDRGLHPFQLGLVDHKKVYEITVNFSIHDH